ncbi:MAG: exopolysaccharide biosynthesis protein, partial [Pseudomonadota bacterium]|nr:exopolysaccharide biosynthesis protein [Pseudomonadota bacterium]
MNPPPTNVTNRPERISELMRALLDGALHEERVSIGQILETFGVRGFAFLMLVLSLLNIVIFMLPLVSILFGVPMIVLAVQMVLGLPVPVFPRFVRQWTIPGAALVRGLEQSIVWMRKIERYIQPRLLILSSPQFEKVHG